MFIDIGNKIIKYRECTKFIDRLKGLMFKKNINEGLCFPKCNSIHTFFMFSNIDVIMTDKDNTILYIYNNLKPFRIILPKKNVYYIYELPSNVINDLNVGDKLKKLDI